ncbi:MAG: hypothetical protein GXP55_05900 [Deltaproteobacteria bacterium]|nr:hypothetical protein [Deltaproteobacteria bacterium]
MNQVTRRAIRSLVVALVFALTPLALPHHGAAQGAGIRGRVIVVLAKEEAGTVDPSLRSMSALSRPPFNSYRTMSVLSRERLTLRTGHPEQVELPNGRRLQVELQRIMPDGRFRVRISINRPGRQDYLPLLTVVAAPGDPFFVAGQGYSGGTLIIGVTLGG